MKLNYLVLALLLLAGTEGYAQQKRDTVRAPSGPKKAKMKTELGLNKKQAAEVKESKIAYKAGREKVKNDTTLSETEKTAKIKKLKAEKKKEINATLTPEQKEKAKALKKEKDEKKEKKKG